MDTTKVDILNKSIELLVTESAKKASDENSIWKILVPVIIGAVLALVAQILIEYLKSGKEKTKRKNELISKGRAKTYLIAQTLKDVAMYKAHKRYYYRAYEVFGDADDLKKHYEKGEQQRKVESELDKIISEYFEIVSEYHILTNKKDDYKHIYETIFKYEHPKPKTFEANVTTELVRELDKEEERLKGIYEKDFLSKFIYIQSEMS